jgi:hypothetical protein
MDIGEGMIIDSGICYSMDEMEQKFSGYLDSFNASYKGLKLIRSSRVSDSKCFETGKTQYRKVMRVHYFKDKPEEWREMWKEKDFGIAIGLS